MYSRLALYNIYFACFISGYVAAYDPVPRWGQAAVIINDALFVHGGKTDASNSFSYTAAPNSNDLLYLSLSTSFSNTQPPWQLVLSSENSSSVVGPALSWHTLSAFNTSHVLLFGGQPGPNSPIVLVDGPDSAWLLNVYNRLGPSFITEPESWANEPIRRIHHSSTTTTSGKVILIGGEKADDSRIAFSQHYVFDPNTLSFTILSSSGGPPAITGHSSVMLPDGRLLVLGGYLPAEGNLVPLSMVWALDTNQSPPTWSSVNVSGASIPSPRRAFAATVIPGGKVLIHGGSNAILQSNLGDGWILDPTTTPMVWTQIDELSQIGARRDHFAVSYGSQVIFGFGYGNNGPAPVSLQVYDTEKTSVTPDFTPLPLSSTPTRTLPLPSQTTTGRNDNPATGISGTSIHPSKTVDNDPADPTHSGGGGDPQESKNKKTTAVVIGTILGVLAVLAVVLAYAYYLRRRQRQAAGERRFMALQGSDGDDESPQSVSAIPAARYPQGISTRNDHQNWNFLNHLGLAGLTAAVTGRHSNRNIPERRDMLADEDTRDFGAWYDSKKRDGSGGSSWSLMSVIGGRKRSREPSITGSTGGVSWKEKGDPFSTALPMSDEDTAYTASSRPQGRRQMSYTSTRSYHDPFADPILEEGVVPHDDEEDDEALSTRPFLHPIPPQLPTLRTVLPVSQGGHTLSPLSERTSQNTLSVHDPSNSVSSHSDSHNSPFDGSSSQVTSQTSQDRSRSFTSSIVGALPSNKPMRRSDSWWTRFSRTSFLDRRASDSSRYMPDFRDPNPPPRLVSIQETSQSASPEHSSPGSQPSSASHRQPSAILRRASRLMGGHNKSLSSVKTADTEAIERMAGVMDVAQLARSGSGRTASTGTTASGTRPNSWLIEDYTPEALTSISPPGMSRIGPDTQTTQALASSSAAIVTSPSSLSKDSPPSSGAVAARIQEFERRQTLDPETPQVGERGAHEGSSNERKQSRSVNYGLIPRQSLYVANPDRRTLSSDDP